MKKTITLFIILLAVIATQAAEPGSKPQSKRLKVGLVLGGGGAKGAAEAGVLKTIEEVGIPIDYIAGTSIGSIVGGLYSCGWRSAQLDSMFRTQEWTSLLTDRNDSLASQLITKKDGITYVLGMPVRKSKKRNADNTAEFDTGKKGMLQGDSIVALLDRMTGRTDSINFDNLPIPFRCVAVDAKHLQEVVLKSGKLSVAMRSSMAIPGVFHPVEMDSMLLVDGGALNNLPVDVVRRMGADVVIAIDLTQNKREARNKKWKKRKGLSMLLQWVKVRPDLIKYNENVKDCDVYINPDLKGLTAADFTPKKIEKMISQGYKAGEAAKKDLKALKKRIYLKR